MTMVLGAALMAAAGAGACEWKSPPSSLVFSPPLDPSQAVTRTATATLVVSCGPVDPIFVTSGANGSVPYRLKHAVLDAVIPYTAALTWLGKYGSHDWSYLFTVTVLGADYADAYAGTYSDILTISLGP